MAVGSRPNSILDFVIASRAAKDDSRFEFGSKLEFPISGIEYPIFWLCYCKSAIKEEP